MIKHNIRIFAYCIIGLAFITYIVISLFTQDLQAINWYKALINISTTISINIFFWVVFTLFIWKWKIFHPWLVKTPNLNGNWTGTIISNWEGGNKEPIMTTLTITQNFFSCQVGIKTGESKSYSLSSSFNIDKERGLNQLLYTYLNTPKPGVRDRSEIHYGTAILNLENIKTNTIDGEYWTSRETTGELKLERTMPNK